MSKPKRSLAITLVAWITMVAGGLLVPISFISLLMLMVGSHGSQTTDPTGFFSVVVAPPLTFVAGLGLLLGWRWSRYYMLLLPAVLIVINIQALASGGKTTTYHITASGETTTSENVWGGPNFHSLPIITCCTAVIIVLLLPSSRREFSGQSALPTEKTVAPSPVATPVNCPPVVPPAFEGKSDASKVSRATLACTVLFLFGCSFYLGWLVLSGLESGTVKDILLRSSLQITVERGDSPFMFGFLIAVYSVGGLGAAGLAFLFVVLFVRPDWAPYQKSKHP